MPVMLIGYCSPDGDRSAMVEQVAPALWRLERWQGSKRVSVTKMRKREATWAAEQWTK